MHRVKGKQIKEITSRYATGLFIFSFVMMTLFCYRDYLTGTKLLISTGDAMDLYDQFYPNLVNRAQHIEKGNTDIQMDFTRALGIEFSLGIPTFATCSAYFGTDNVAYLMGLTQILKVIIAGVSFYFYIILMGKKPYVASVCAVAYAFCGHMAVRQFWLSYATEVTVFAFWLLGYELWERRKNRAWLPLATVILVINLSSIYYFILYMGIMGAYIVFRTVFLEDISVPAIKKIVLQVLLCFLVAAIVFGVPQIAAQISQLLSNSRFQSGVSDIADSDVFYFKFQEINTLICQTLGINMLGNGKVFSGVMGYLGAPTFYIGLLGLMLLIPIFLRLKMRQKVCVGIVALGAASYIFINALRKLVNGFSGDSYKLSSFWIIVVLIFIVAQGLDEVLADFRKSDLSILFAEAVIMEKICAYNLRQTEWKVDDVSVLTVMGITALYIIIFVFYFFGQWGKGKRLILGMFMVLAFLDAGLQMEGVLQKMHVMNREHLESRTRYNDYTLEALEYLGERNALQDYRVNKQFFSYRYNDAWIQGYYGTSFYLGGVGAGNNVIELYEMMKLPCAGSEYKYAHGTSPFTEINTAIGVKYILSKDVLIINYGYEQIYNENGICIFENENAVPMGYGYDKYITKEEYNLLDLNSRRKSIVSAAIVDDLTDAENHGLKKVGYAELNVGYDKYVKYMVDVSMEHEEKVYHLPRAIEANEVLAIRAKSPLDEPLYRGTFNYYIGDKWIQYIVRMDKEEEQVFDINAEGVSAFSFAQASGGELLEMNDVVAYIIPKQEYYKEYASSVEELKENSMDIKSFSGKYISGTVTMDQDRIFCLAVPYGNWEIYIDGKKVNTFLVNVAFTGCLIEKGEHLIEAKYSNISTTINIITQYIATVAALIWMAICQFIYKKRLFTVF